MAELRIVEQISDGVNRGDDPEAFGKSGEGARSIAGVSAYGACPKCGKEYQLAIVREGEVRMRESRFRCRDVDCGGDEGTELPFRKEVEAFIADQLAPKPPKAKAEAKAKPKPDIEAELDDIEAGAKSVPED